MGQALQKALSRHRRSYKSRKFEGGCLVRCDHGCVRPTTEIRKQGQLQKNGQACLPHGAASGPAGSGVRGQTIYISQTQFDKDFHVTLLRGRLEKGGELRQHDDVAAARMPVVDAAYGSGVLLVAPAFMLFRRLAASTDSRML